MTRSDDSRSSGGSATDPLIPAPDASSRSSLGNAPFAPRASRGLAPSSTFPPATTTSTPPRPRSRQRDALIRHPAHFDSFNSVMGRPPRLDGVEERARGRRARPRRILESTDPGAPAGPGPTPREEHARCPGGRHATSAATKRDGRDVGYAAAMDAGSRRRDRGGRRPRGDGTARRTGDVARARHAPPRANPVDRGSKDVTRRGGRPISRARKGPVEKRARARRGDDADDGAVNPPARAPRAVPPWRGRGEPPRRRRRIDRTGRRRPRGFRGRRRRTSPGSGAARPLRGGAGPRRCEEGCPPGDPSRDADGGEDARSRSERGPGSARARAADGVAVKSGVESVQAVDARTVALPSAPPGRAGLFFPALPPRPPPELGPAPSSSSSLDQSSQSCLPFFPLRGILARERDVAK